MVTVQDDVTVVGGGIAGAAAVIALAQKGVSVCWIRPPVLTKTNKVGESLAPAANPILSALGLSNLLENSGHRKANSTFSAWGQEVLMERNSVVHLEGAGHIIDRALFEQDLDRLATEACSSITDGMLQSVSVDHGCWYLMTDQETRSVSRFVVDATGRAQMIGRFLTKHHNLSIETSDHLVAAYAFVRQKDNSDVLPTPATLIESVPDGWWYASLLPSNELALNFYSDPDLLPRGLTSDLTAWQSLIKQTQQISYWLDDADFIVDQPPQLTSAATRWLSSAAGVYEGAGWASIGDAAVAFDPLSAHGMTTALWAAARAPDLVSAYMAQDYSVLEQYATAVALGRDNYLEQRNTIYSQEKRYLSQPFWQRRSKG